jgi:D-alanyl-D-alanine carboxypeptidase/D-alanyl-D-alanine-endopeptidase (penicillin-binding protein 4)
MRRSGFVVLAILGPAVLCFRAPAQSIERAVAAAEALGAHTGVAVCDADGHVLYRHRATEPMAPASNMKVLTAAAVLHGLGADYEFKTRFRLRDGRLVVQASGDPNWIHETEHAPERVFGLVAAALQRLSVREIAGIDLDPGTFVGPPRPATWPQDQLYTYYCAPTGPFVLEQSALVVGISAPADRGQADVYLVAPSADLPLRGSIELVDSSKGATYGASDTGDAVAVRGRFYRKSPPVSIRTAMRDPAVWYLASLRQALAKAGITVGVGISGGAAGGPGDTLVYEHKSRLAPAMLRMLEDSSNFDAEQCLRVLGHHTLGDGSLQGGLLALEQEVKKQLGQVPEGIVLADGSGLSRQNRLTAGTLVVALFASCNGPGGAMLRDCLPVSGRSGTLSGRFTGTNLVGRVRAKTGWIRGASSLSGLVEREDGTRRWFSILMSYDQKQDGLNKDLKQLQEQIVQAIDGTGLER